MWRWVFVVALVRWVPTWLVMVPVAFLAFVQAVFLGAFHSVATRWPLAVAAQHGSGAREWKGGFSTTLLHPAVSGFDGRTPGGTSATSRRSRSGSRRGAASSPGSSDVGVVRRVIRRRGRLRRRPGRHRRRLLGLTARNRHHLPASRLCRAARPVAADHGRRRAVRSSAADERPQGRLGQRSPAARAGGLAHACRDCRLRTCTTLRHR